MIELRISEAAAHSILEQGAYFRESADDTLVIRWESAIEQAIHSLLEFPERGTLCRFVSPQLAGIRWIFVPGFARQMVFYRYSPDEHTLLIIQVLHGARNLETLISNE